MKQSLFLWMLLSLAPAGAALAQLAQGTVLGHDSLALPGTAVANVRTRSTTLTDDLGRFSLQAVPGDTLLVQALGHLPASVVVVGMAPLVVYLRPRVEQLSGVEIRQRSRRQDSLETREQFRSAFNFRRPRFREVVMVTPVGVGVNIHKLYRALSFSSNRAKSTFRRRLIEYEQAQYTSGRFTDSLVARHTGLPADSLSLFMKSFPPTYKFALEAPDYDFILYIRQACDSFRRGLPRPGAFR
ncbi:carboxypeptidase-like regulatory domain-containing protein [Chitinophaga pollutisoli]|uniref:Carboxypeptidase-like regulatory domain-containing protein n=1 Tax=Chitinophaga pollutisoli TaxID=3133966 RepID=A0ABZ2YY79_9BACT